MELGTEVSPPAAPGLKGAQGSPDHLGDISWTASMAVTAYGVRMGIRVTDVAVLARIREYLPFGWKPSSSSLVARLYSLVVAGDSPHAGEEQMHVLYSDGAEIARTQDLDEALRSLESSAQLYVAEMATRRVFVHAGVVGWHDRAILIPGRSFTGKTTLVVELVRPGATYYSDEYAVLDDRGFVYPFLRPLRIRNEVLRQEKHNPEVLGGRVGVGPLPVGLVAVTGYRAGARWRPRRLSPGVGALALLDNTVPARRRPEAVLTTLHAVVSRATVLKGVRGEAIDIAPRLLKKLDQAQRTT